MRLIPMPAAAIHFVRGRQVDTAVAIYAAICVGFSSSGGYTTAWAALAVPFLALAALCSDSRTTRFGAVLGIAAVMGGLVAMNYYVIANHGFMLFWLGLALAITCACDPPQDEAVLRRIATLLLAILMAFALIQKLREPYYMDGDLLGGLLAMGEIYGNLISMFVPEWPSLVADHEAVYRTVMAEPVATSAAIAMPPAVAALAWRMTVSSLIAQGVLEVMILFRARVGILLHFAILGFVLLVYSTRDENAFLAINCFLGYAMTDERSAAMRPWYVVAVIYLISTMVIGLRPWIIS